MTKILRLGTRSSPLAMIQAEEVRQKLSSSMARLGQQYSIEIVPMKTKGDWQPGQQDRRFLDMGSSKEFFTKEIEEALLNGSIDIAVHSMKDLSSILPPRLVIAAVLDREDPRDAFICSKASNLEGLPKGATIGTSSLRRQAQILARRPDLTVVPLRGNVETRIEKLTRGIADATLLAVAGLNRLGRKDAIASILPTEIVLPAAAQGVIGIEVREDDNDMQSLLAPLNVEAVYSCVRAERAFLRSVEGSCKTPIGALASLKDKRLTLEGLVARPDGSSFVRLSESGPDDNPEALGYSLGAKLRDRAPADYFAA